MAFASLICEIVGLALRATHLADSRSRVVSLALRALNLADLRDLIVNLTLRTLDLANIGRSIQCSSLRTGNLASTGHRIVALPFRTFGLAFARSRVPYLMGRTRLASIIEPIIYGIGSRAELASEGSGVVVRPVRRAHGDSIANLLNTLLGKRIIDKANPTDNNLTFPRSAIVVEPIITSNSGGLTSLRASVIVLRLHAQGDALASRVV